MTISSTFCVLPWIQLYVGNSGVVDSCCFSVHPDEDLEGPLPLVSQQINGPRMEKIRSKLLAGVSPQSCERCFSQESQGLSSLRTRSNDKYQDVIITHGKYFSQPVVDPLNWSRMDLRLGNLCNLKCRMCSPGSTERLYEEWNKSPSKEMRDHLKKINKSRNWNRSVGRWEDLISLSSNVEEVTLAGGEPLLDQSHQGLLSHWIKSGQSHEMMIHYITNLTVLPEQLLKNAQYFKKFVVGVSIDGWEGIGEYIRHPLHWNSFWKNVLDLDESFTEFPQGELYFTTTVQAYNILHIPELLTSLRKAGLKKFSPIPKFSYLSQPDFLQAQVLPREIRHRARKIWCESEYSNEEGPELRELNLFYRKNLLEGPECSELFLKFKRYTKYFDESRSESVVNVLSGLGK